MRKIILRTIDFSFAGMWCLLLSVRAFSTNPGLYSILDKVYVFFILPCFLADIIMVGKTKLYQPWKEHIFWHLTRLLLIAFPLVLMLVLGERFTGGIRIRKMFF